MSSIGPDHSDSNVWGLKYRPKTIDECVLPAQLRTEFTKILESGKIPNLLFHTFYPGSGKTTMATILCETLGYDVLFMNASSQNSIDDIRNTVTNFCSSVSLDDKPKVVFWDESDRITSSAQDAARSIIEQFSGVTFIATCNYIRKLSDPFRSRFSEVSFKIPEEERTELLKQFIVRVFGILDKENVEYDRKVVAQFVSKYFPDYRKTLNQLQRYAMNGKIDAGILSQVADVRVDGLFDAIKHKKFSDARKWIGENTDLDWETFYGQLYEFIYDKIEPSTIPPAILILSKYQFQSSTVADQQLNFSAAVVELMSEVVFK